MKTIPINNIIAKIKAEKSLSEEEINTLINNKVSELSGLVSEEGAAHIVANELGVTIFQNSEPEEQNMKLSELKPSMRNLTLTGKVTNLFDLVTFERDSNPGKVRSLILADETGRTRVSFWHKAAEAIDTLKQDDIITIKQVSTRENNGRIDCSVQNPEDILINPEGITIEVTSNPISEDIKTKKIVELSEGPASLLGTIVQIFKPTFYQRCPECNKKAENNVCQNHPEAQPVTACIQNLVLDDGSDSIRCVFFNNQVEELTGKSIEEIQANSEEVKNELLGKIIKVTGNIRHSEFLNTTELVVNKIEKEINLDKEKENLQ